MPNDEITIVHLPPDFARRQKEFRRRRRAGQQFTMEQAAELLGVDFEFLSAVSAVHLALLTGQPVLVDPSTDAKPH
ncbi:MAG: hypothetical protein RO009_03765 [Pseudorhodoplanes sp.]|nr:hypothetical protein [Pseudorhodoplanes sp.]